MSDLTVSLIQANLHWEDIAANLAMFDQKIDAIKERTEVILLPEMFSTGFSMQPEKLAEKMDGSAVQWMKQKAKQKNAIIGGSLIIEEDGEYYNRFIWMLPNGQYGVYNKRHRFGFAGEDNYYAAGEKRIIAQVKGWKICLTICYDLRFPVWSRNTIKEDGQPEYDVLVNVANWPERRNVPWRALLQARAIENQCYMIGVNRVGNDGNDIYHSGDSSIIDPVGEIVYHKAHDEDVFTYTLSRQHLTELRGKFPFMKDADKFMIL
ncbi:amidohydrolase [Chitinophaga deserti]|uniref:amidohydrolase n=1 Tax=Chitinophaga deserti TaxID=2164099 RepID=UPI000D6BB1D5|nr:amidohydrolase [Chitinophaga deserti]